MWIPREGWFYFALHFMSRYYEMLNNLPGASKLILCGLRSAAHFDTTLHIFSREGDS